MSEKSTILVDLNDGCCRSCGGKLQIFHVDDCSLEVECVEEDCLDAYKVEPDAFADGGITYWPQAMVAFGQEAGE
ncbi:MAG: hypothetical protein KDA93_01690 [Planctomycetaceae bacterium]|nr:hypothetical protein [Planctomycetaceae bacterium]